VIWIRIRIRIPVSLIRIGINLMAHYQLSLKIPCKSVRQFLRVSERQTEKQTDKQTNNDDYISSLAEVRSLSRQCRERMRKEAAAADLALFKIIHV